MSFKKSSWHHCMELDMLLQSRAIGKMFGDYASLGSFAAKLVKHSADLQDAKAACKSS